MAAVGMDGALLWLMREEKVVLWRPGLRRYPVANHGEVDRVDFHGEGQIWG